MEVLRGRDRVSLIAEFKRRSPSRGAIRDDALVVPRVEDYARAGASAISVLTEAERFGGSLDDLALAVRATHLPVLMKDFITSETQLEAGARLGAAAALLIVRYMSEPRLRELAAACRRLGLAPLVECHDAAEIDAALRIDDALIGVNNRDLETFEIDCARGRRLLERVPGDRIAVAESGFLDPGAVRELRGIADAALVGSALMAADDPAAFILEATR